MKLVLHYLTVVVHVGTCLFLIAVVLLQQGKGQDLASAFGGGVTQTAFGPRGSANLLSRLTTILAGVFMVTSLTLSVLRPSSSGIESLPAAPSAAPVASPAAPGASPAAPAASPAQPDAAAPSNAAPANAAPAAPATTPAK